MDCESNFNDPWCFCFNAKNESVPQYKQFDANNSQNSRGVGFHCCHLTHHDPSFIAKKIPSQGNINSAVEYLTLLNNSVTNNVCDYNKYLDQVSGDVQFNNQFPDLFETANTDRILFNAFYNKDNIIHNGNITSNEQLLPVFENNKVSCPVSNYIPYYIAYENNEFIYTRYIYICYPKKISFPNLSVSYKSIYFNDNNGNDCKSNNCTTKYELTNAGINAGNISHDNIKNDKLNMLTIIIITVSSVLIFIAIILIIYFSLKDKKLKTKSGS